jgi:hypothetical protein
MAVFGLVVIAAGAFVLNWVFKKNHSKTVSQSKPGT